MWQATAAPGRARPGEIPAYWLWGVIPVHTIRILLVVSILALAGCAPRSSATTWEYSRWSRQGGGEKRAFQAERSICLERIKSAASPGAVRPDSAQEQQFLACMNGAGWCTDAFGCDPP